MSEITTYERYRLGQAYLDAGDPLSAARVLEPAVEAEPTSAALWSVLAKAYFASSRLRRAETAFERVVELDPSDDHAGWKERDERLAAEPATVGFSDDGHDADERTRLDAVRSLDRNDLGAASYNAGLANILAAQRRCGSAVVWRDIAPCLVDITGAGAHETLGYSGCGSAARGRRTLTPAHPSTFSP